MNEAPNAVESIEDVAPQQSSEEPSNQLADDMTESLLSDEGELAWDRQFPASCGKGWG